MGYQKIGIFLVIAVAIALFSYNLGQQEPIVKEQTVVKESDLPDASINTDVSSSQPIQTATARAQILDSGAGTVGLPDTGRIAHFEIGNRNVKGIYAEAGQVWFATSGGVIRYDTSSDQYTVFDNKTPGILSNGIFHVSRIDDRLLVGSYGGGLSVMDVNTGLWSNYNVPQGLADQFVYDSQLASNGDLWIATWSGVNRVAGARLDDPEGWDTFTVENTEGGLPNPWVYGVEEGVNGEMWFATETGLARYQDGKWTNWQHEDGLGAPIESVRDAIKFTNDPAKASRHHAQQKAEQGLSDIDVAYNPNYIISLEVDASGDVWAGTWGGGLAHFDGNKWTNFTTADGLPGNHIFMLYMDTSDTLWVGTSKGLARMDQEKNTFTNFTVRDGLFANNVFSMADGVEDSIWIGSFGGVARIAQSTWSDIQKP
ncbi:MAG: regulator [Gammaproteobacteria bacterium]|nr:regulator [Gammaproteobacteria bacterium]